MDSFSDCFAFGCAILTDTDIDMHRVWCTAYMQRVYANKTLETQHDTYMDAESLFDCGAKTGA